MSYGTYRPHDVGRVLERVKVLKGEGAAERQDRQRIRAIMNGGPRGIAAVMAWDQGRQGADPASIVKAYGHDMPAVNLLASGVERLAQQVGDIPVLRAAEAYERDLREKFSRIRNVVADWDRYQQLEAHFPQIGRWLPGYAVCLWVLGQSWYRYARDTTPYPRAELRDSYDVYPGYGVVEPEDVLVVRSVPLAVLRNQYPDINWGAATAELTKKINERGMHANRGDAGGSRWEGETGDMSVEVNEYLDNCGRSLVIPDLSLPLGFMENPIFPEPPFVMLRKYSFDSNISAYHHVIGMYAMMAKLNVLGLIASEDSVFRPTNIIGELESATYQEGRFAVNVFSPGSKVEKPAGDQPQTLWAQIDRIERQLRIGAAYDVSSDGISPNSYATQAGILELKGGTARNVAEYQKVIRLAAERLDARRLMWAEAVWPNDKTKVFYYGTTREKTYTPKTHIAGNYRTRRMTPLGDIWGSSQNGVMGMQLVSGKILDVETMQDAIPGIADGEAILQRIRARTAEEALIARIAGAPPGQDLPPGAAEKLLLGIMLEPDRQDELLEEYVNPPEAPMPEAPPMPPGMPGMEPGAGAPPGVWDMLNGSRRTQTALSRVMDNGQADAGVQLVGQIG